MKLRITRISAVRASGILTGIYALLMAVLGAAHLIWSVFQKGPRQPVDMTNFAPMLIVLAASYFSILIFCVLYNLTAKWIGGIEVTVEEKEN